MVKKITRIITKCVCCFVALVLLLYIGIGFFGGFHLKSIPCAGGFRTSLYQSELENIKAACGGNLTEDQLDCIKFYLGKDPENGRIMTTKYVDKNGEEVRLQCKMNWYWSGEYKWSIIE